MIMATKPLTLVYGLTASPVGLAAWLTGYGSSGLYGKEEKLAGLPQEELETRFRRDELLTNVMIYWVTQTIYSAARAYYENMQVYRVSSWWPLYGLGGAGTVRKGYPGLHARTAKVDHFKKLSNAGRRRKYQ